MSKKLSLLIILVLIFLAYGCKKPESVTMPKFSFWENLPKTQFEHGAPVFMRIFKKESELEVWMQNGKGYDLYKTYRICRYSGELGPKLREGDRQSPEGFYRVKRSSLNPNSSYHLSFNLGFPNSYDRVHGRTGSYLMVHGSCVSIGCYAMTDKRIEEIYGVAETALKNGQSAFQVHIFPFRMTAENMKKYRDSQWHDFWLNLKEGYDLFERDRVPPTVSVRGKRYVFKPAADSTT